MAGNFGFGPGNPGNPGDPEDSDNSANPNFNELFQTLLFALTSQLYKNPQV